MERATGFEPVTSSLEGWNSTTELRPPFRLRYFSVAQKLRCAPDLALTSSADKVFFVGAK